MSDEKRSTEPHDKLTKLCAVMMNALEADPDHDESVKCIVFLDDGKRGGIVLHGYDDDTEAIADLMVHLRAIFKANGKEFLVVPLRQG